MIGDVRKSAVVVVHGANTSFSIDLPYGICPQAAKQAAKLVLFKAANQRVN